MIEPADDFFLDLPYAFAGRIESFANFFGGKRVFVVLMQKQAQLNAFLAYYSRSKVILIFSFTIPLSSVGISPTFLISLLLSIARI